MAFRMPGVERPQRAENRRIPDPRNVDLIQQAHNQVLPPGLRVHQGQPGTVLVGVPLICLGQCLQLLLNLRGLPGILLQHGYQLPPNLDPAQCAHTTFQVCSEHGRGLFLAAAAGGDFCKGQSPLQPPGGPLAGIFTQSHLLRFQKRTYSIEVFVEYHRRFQPELVAGTRIRQLATPGNQLLAGRTIAQPPLDRKQQHPQIEVLPFLFQALCDRRAGLCEQPLLDHELDQVEQILQVGLFGGELAEQSSGALPIAHGQIGFGQLTSHVQPCRLELDHPTKQLGRVRLQHRPPQEPGRFQQAGGLFFGVDGLDRLGQFGQRFAGPPQQIQRLDVQQDQVGPLGLLLDSLGQIHLAAVRVSQPVQQLQRPLFDLCRLRQPPPGLEQHLQGLAAQL